MPQPSRSSGSQRRRRRKPKPGRESRPPLVIITGLSGSGKGTVLRTLEDLGYHCIDNLPIPLIRDFADLYGKNDQMHRIALVVDIRGGEALEDFPALFRSLRRRLPATLVFVEASGDTLVRRFAETRRPHPLGTDLSVNEGIRKERALLKPIRGLADVVIDTTDFTPHELRELVNEKFATTARKHTLLISLVSFGYRYGVPEDASLVFDVRFLPNPNFVPALRPLTGRNPRVATYVLSSPRTREFLQRVEQLLAYLVPRYVDEGKSYLTIAFGCTGGRHRSVAITHRIGEQLSSAGRRVKLHHRDMHKEE